jgi:hypothetical protein
MKDEKQGNQTQLNSQGIYHMQSFRFCEETPNTLDTQGNQQI